MLISVFGSEGTLFVGRDGVVVDRHPDNAYPDVVAVNLDEFSSHWGYELDRLPEAMDVLDVGLRLVDGQYLAPESDWREHVIRPSLTARQNR